MSATDAITFSGNAAWRAANADRDAAPIGEAAGDTRYKRMKVRVPPTTMSEMTMSSSFQIFMPRAAIMPETARPRPIVSFNSI